MIWTGFTTPKYFVFVLRHSNSISVISYWWYDVWDEEGKAWAYILPTQGIFNIPTETGFYWRCKLYTVGTWITAQLNIIAVTGFVPQLPGSPIKLSPQPQGTDQFTGGICLVSSKWCWLYTRCRRALLWIPNSASQSIFSAFKMWL